MTETLVLMRYKGFVLVVPAWLPPAFWPEERRAFMESVDG